MLAADQPFVQLAEQPEGLFAHLGKRRRRKGDWTADQDRQLILQFWRHLIDPAKWPAKDITVDEGLRHGEAVKMRLKTLRRDPYFAALLPTTAPPFLATYRDLCDVILDPARLAAFRTRAGASADPAPAASAKPKPEPASADPSTRRRGYPVPSNPGVYAPPLRPAPLGTAAAARSWNVKSADDLPTVPTASASATSAPWAPESRFVAPDAVAFRGSGV